MKLLFIQSIFFCLSFDVTLSYCNKNISHITNVHVEYVVLHYTTLYCRQICDW